MLKQLNQPLCVLMSVFLREVSVSVFITFTCAQIGWTAVTLQSNRGQSASCNCMVYHALTHSLSLSLWLSLPPSPPLSSLHLVFYTSHTHRLSLIWLHSCSDFDFCFIAATAKVRTFSIVC